MGFRMAENTGYEMTKPGSSAMDYAEHERTYALFIGLAKWGIIGCVAIMVLMAIFLV